MLTKEEKLAILSKAIDEGADINIHFHNMQQGKANKLISEFAESMSVKMEQRVGDYSQWYSASTETFTEELKVTAFFKPEYMVEDVNFEEETVDEAL